MSLKKVQHVKCDHLLPTKEGDRLCPVDRHNPHNSALIEIFLRKVQHKKCDPSFKEDSYGPVNRPNLQLQLGY